MGFFTTLDIIEYPWIRFLQNLDGTLLDTFSMYISNIALMLASFGLIIVYMIWQKNKLWKPLLFAVIASGAISYTINEWLFKILFSEIGIFRPRPWIIHPDILAIGHTFRDSSFPSSHMAFTTLMMMIVTYFETKFLKYGVIIILVMWLSRIHNGMHYPTDVLIGTCMGAIYAFLGLWLMKKTRLEKKHWWEQFFH